MGRAVREDAATVKAAASVHDGGAGVVLRHRLWRVEALPPHFDDNGALRVAGWARRGVSAAAAAAAGASSCARGSQCERGFSVGKVKNAAGGVPTNLARGLLESARRMAVLKLTPSPFSLRCGLELARRAGLFESDLCDAKESVTRVGKHVSSRLNAQCSVTSTPSRTVDPSGPSNSGARWTMGHLQLQSAR